MGSHPRCAPVPGGSGQTPPSGPSPSPHPETSAPAPARSGSTALPLPRPPRPLPAPAGLVARDSSGRGLELQPAGKHLWDHGVERMQTSQPPHSPGLSAGTTCPTPAHTPPGASRHPGGAVMPSPQPFAERKNLRSLQVPRDPPSGLLAPPLDESPSPDDSLPLVPRPFPGSLVCPSPIHPFRFLPHDLCFCRITSLF